MLRLSELGLRLPYGEPAGIRMVAGREVSGWNAGGTPRLRSRFRRVVIDLLVGGFERSNTEPPWTSKLSRNISRNLEIYVNLLAVDSTSKVKI